MLAPRIRYNIHAVHRSRLRLCTQFMTSIDARLKIIGEDTFEGQELSSARKTLVTAQARAKAALEELPAQQLNEAEEERRRMNEVLESQQVAMKLAFVEKLRACGDYRQAKIHLLATLQIRREIENESTL